MDQEDADALAIDTLNWEDEGDENGHGEDKDDGEDDDVKRKGDQVNCRRRTRGPTPRIRTTLKTTRKTASKPMRTRTLAMGLTVAWSMSWYHMTFDLY
jgi:hypothetical protein